MGRRGKAGNHMARFSLRIAYPLDELRRTAERNRASVHRGYADRVPVGFCITPRIWTPVAGIPYGDLFRDVETHYALQLDYLKWRLEHVREDFCAGPVLTVSPFFDNVANASAFGAEVPVPENETLRALPVVHAPEDMARVALPAHDAGWWGKQIAWWHAMHELCAATEVFFDGTPGRVEMGPLSVGGEGPHIVAVDLAGTDFYLWQVDRPEECRAFLAKITAGMAAAERRMRQIDPRPRGAYGVAEDSAQAMSADMFRTFCLPYDEALFREFGAGLDDGRGMHMCGKSAHLHAVLVDELAISSFNVFGAAVPPEVAAQNLGGRCRLWGNVDPVLMLTGTRAAVKAAARRCLEAMAPFGGFTLGDGANVCPGTPLGNLNALVEAAEEYGNPLARR